MVSPPSVQARPVDVVGALRQRRTLAVRAALLVGADLRGADLSGVRLSLCGLAGAKMREANLRGAVLEHVDLAAADLTGTDLRDALLRHVNLGSSQLTRADLRGARLDHCDVTAADLTAADLSAAWIHRCFLDGSALHGARLCKTELVASSLERVGLGDADLTGSVSRGCSFRDAELLGARGFCTNRDAVVEVLRAGVDDDVERAQAAGAVAQLPHWCWDAWRRYWRDAPAYLQHWVLAQFAAHPASGCAQALFQQPEPTS